MPSSYQKRIDEINELRRKNKILEEELNKMRSAIDILNNSIFRTSRIIRTDDSDLKLEFEELCKEMDEE